MEGIFMTVISLISLFILYFIIKTAVSKGIDSSEEIINLKHEIRDLKKQLKSEQEQNKHIINARV